MKKILVVDDDQTLRVVLKRYLENQGYLVSVVHSGIDALEVFDREPPDLVVSDIIMPQMDGFEFCRRLRAKRSGQLVPFIFLSSRDELDYRVEGHSIGADDYLSKPFEPRELVAKIEAQLERTRRIYSEMVRLMQQGVNFEDTSGSVLPSHQSPKANSETSEGSKSNSEREPLPLTPAEARVFWEVVEGYTNKQIAERLFISPRTVQTHLSHILGKLKLENRSQLVRFAFEQGYEPPTNDRQDNYQLSENS
jgi:DNA-binding NarL/FixJ family response regulator